MMNISLRREDDLIKVRVILQHMEDAEEREFECRTVRQAVSAVRAIANQNHLPGYYLDGQFVPVRAASG